MIPRLGLNYLKAVALGVEEIGYFNQFRYVRDLAVFGFVAFFLIVLWLPKEYAWTYLLGAVLTPCIVALFGVKMLLKYAKVRLAWNKQVIKELIVRGLVFSFGAILLQLNYKMDILILGEYMKSSDPPVTASDITNYTVGVAFAKFLWQIPIVMGAVLFSRSVNTKNPLEMARKTARLVRIGTVLAVPPAIFLWVFAPWIFPFIYGSQIDQADEVIRILLPGILAFFSARMMEADLTGKGKPWRVVSVMLPVVLGNIVLNIIFIPMWGINGAAITSTSTYIFGSIAMIFVYSRATGLSLREILVPRKSDFQLKFGRKKKGNGQEPADADAHDA